MNIPTEVQEASFGVLQGTLETQDERLRIDPSVRLFAKMPNDYGRVKLGDQRVLHAIAIETAIYCLKEENGWIGLNYYRVAELAGFKGTPDSRRQSVTRALKGLEAKGLIETVSEGKRVTKARVQVASGWFKAPLMPASELEDIETLPTWLAICKELGGFNKEALNLRMRGTVSVNDVLETGYISERTVYRHLSKLAESETLRCETSQGFASWYEVNFVQWARRFNSPILDRVELLARRSLTDSEIIERVATSRRNQAPPKARKWQLLKRRKVKSGSESGKDVRGVLITKRGEKGSTKTSSNSETSKPKIEVDISNKVEEQFGLAVAPSFAQRKKRYISEPPIRPLFEGYGLSEVAPDIGLSGVQEARKALGTRQVQESVHNKSMRANLRLSETENQ